ncbi:MAG: sensor histidine kinase [Gorillibacterium sp.]|nr:sensor histidine kinase [Gorillibacterium sp.]
MKWFSHYHIKTIQGKLIGTSLLLITILSILVYFVTLQVLAHIEAKTQYEYDLYSFQQMDEFVEAIIRNNEIKMDFIYSSSSIQQEITAPLDESAFSALERFRATQASIWNTFSAKDHVGSVLILGRNSSIAYHNLIGSKSTYSKDLDLAQFMADPLIAPYLIDQAAPSFFNPGALINESYNQQRNLYSAMSNQLVVMKKIFGANHTIEGIIITVYNSSLIPDILPKEQGEGSLYLVDASNRVLWPEAAHSPNINFDKLDSQGYATLPATRSLITYSSLNSMSMKIVNEIPLDKITFAPSNFLSYSAWISLICLCIAGIASYFLARFICRPLSEFACLLVNIDMTLSNPLPPLKIWLPYKTLRSKLIYYFSLTVLLPVLLYMAYTGYYQYQQLKSQLVHLTNQTMAQSKVNLDYRLYTFDELTVQIIADSSVQAMLYNHTRGLTPSFVPISPSLYKLMLNAKMYQPNIISVKIYGIDGTSVFSSSSFESERDLAMDPNLLKNLNNSNGNLIFIDSASPAQARVQASQLVFARKLLSLNNSFGSPLGYVIFTMKNDLLNPLIRSTFLTKLESSYLLNPTGDILFDDPMNLTTWDDTLLKLPSDASVPQVLKSNSQLKLVFHRTTDLFGFNIIGIVPNEEIIKQILPLLQISALIMGLLILFAVALSSYIAVSIIRPLKRLQKLTEALDGGNLDQRMIYANKDEIGVLFNQFNRMTRRLNELVIENYQSKLRESELMFLEKEAQFNALQQQINPHFLYNTLESIRWMAYKRGVHEVVDMTVALGKFFRGNIIKGKDIILFQEELDHLSNYLFIQKIRYQDKFKVDIQVEDRVLQRPIIKLILQPLIENAITHGIERMKEGGEITLVAKLINERIQLEIRDNGQGIGRAKLEELRNSLVEPHSYSENIGVANVYKRLQLFYNDKFSFQIHSDGAGLGTSIYLEFPAFPQN